MDKYMEEKNKSLFKRLILLIIVFFIVGLFVTIFLSKDNNKIIKDSLEEFILNINKIDKTYVKNTIINYIVINIVIFILTLSIIGTPLNIVYIAYKSFSLSFTIFNIFKVYKFKGIFLLSYVVPDILNLVVSLVYSFYLIRFNKKLLDKMFKKKDYNINNLMRKNLKLFIICLTLFILNTIIKIYLVPNMIKPFVKFIS